MPPPLQAALAVVLLPVGFGRGVQRLVLLLTISSLALMRATAEESRRLLLGPAKLETGRSRAPREPDALPLYPMCAAASVLSAPSGRGGETQLPGEACGDLLCAALHEPRGLLVLTATRLRCVGAVPGEPPLWELPLARLLLVQQRACSLQLLALAATGAIETHSLALHSDDDAARLHEVLRLAGLNARGTALPPVNPRPMVRTSVLELLA